MKYDIPELKRLLPLDALIAKLGHAPIAKSKARCPFHEDKRDSFSVYRSNGGGFRWKCFAGCGEGDELDFIQKFFDLPDVKAAIRRYADLVGNPIYDEVRNFQGSIAPRKVVVDPIPIVPAKLEKLTTAAAIQIGKWRGLDPLFLGKMSDKGIIGLWDGKPAFATEGGVQYRIPGHGGWRFSSGAKNALLVLGGGLETGDNVCVVESNWDALAFYEYKTSAVICTRGAGNARLAIEYINAQSGGATMTVTLLPHKDRAGEEWAQDIFNGLMFHEIKAKRVPDPYKDFAEYYKASKK